MRYIAALILIPLLSILRLNADRGSDSDTVAPGYIKQAHKGLGCILANGEEMPSERMHGNTLRNFIKMRCDECDQLYVFLGNASAAGR